MGTYFYLVDETEKKIIDLCGHVKWGPIKNNEAVHYAFINYMFQKMGNLFRIADYSEWFEGYERVDLCSSDILSKEDKEHIAMVLNQIYKQEKYKVDDRNNIQEDNP